MTQKERLIELLDNMPCSDKEFYHFAIYVEKIADHLLDNGVIVPPCKVGDAAYLIMAAYSTLDKATYFAEPIEGVIDGVWKGVDDRNEIDIRLNSNFDGQIVYRTFEDYKKTFFLDRKAAEQALKECLQ